MQCDTARVPDRSPDNYRLEWLTSFLAVVDYGGFAAAAEHTYRSQPRISSHVADLERRLGATLFDRRERPVRLTEAGVAFLEHARRTLADIEAGESSVQAVIGILRGRVALGCYPSAGAAFIPELLQTFSNLYPSVAVELREGATSELIEDLYNGISDLAIRPLLPAPHASTILHHTLWEEPLVAVVPKDHSIAKCDYVSLGEVADDRIITIGDVRTDHDDPNEIALSLASAGVSPNIAYRTNEPQTLVALARQGLGVGLTNLLAASICDTEDVTVVPIQESGNRRVVGVFWDSSRAMQPATRALVDLIAQLPVPADVQRYQRRA